MIYSIKRVVVFCLMVVVSVVCGRLEAASQTAILRPVVYLIQDNEIRSELALTEKQVQSLDGLCEELDSLLFSMRDVPPDSTDPKAVTMVGRINKKLNSLSTILNARQQKRLNQLSLQYVGIKALFYPKVQERLGFSSEQVAKLGHIHEQAVSQQRTLQEKQERDDAAVQQTIEKIQQWETNQILKLMNDPQRQLWLVMLGDTFDFSRLRPLTFQVPELEDVTTWINTKPLSMRSLRGRVVIVHFWTFGCHNCVQNYPVYRQWTQRYDPKEVFMLGIHTPEAGYEKDVTELRKRMKQKELSFAVAVDNDKANWGAWFNRVWPSVYLVDKRGRVRYWWYGELRWQGATGDQWIAERIEELRGE